MKALLLILTFILLSSISFAIECIEPYNGMTVKESLFLCNDAFDLPDGLVIGADNLILNCNGAVLRGDYMKERGVLIENRKNVTVTNCNIVTFRAGIHIKNTTNSIIKHNTLLKNNIGILLFDAYENLIENNADKSTKTPVSAITSKFNTVIFVNKVLDQSFCEVNNCNELKDINPCINDDFYCSKRCDYTVDNDCPGAEKISVSDSKSYADIEREAVEEMEAEEIEEKPKLTVEKKGIPWWMHLIVYLTIYLIGFIIVQYHGYKTKSDIFDFSRF